MNKRRISEALGPVFRVYRVKRAVLFGSYAKGVESEKSDVDILVDSGLKGMKFVGMVEQMREALDGREVDVMDVAHVDGGSKIMDEVGRTGVLIYEG